MMRQRFSATLVTAVWFSLAIGLLEGISFLLFQKWRWLNWSAQIVPVDASILWVTPAVNLAVFLLAGLFLLLIFGWVSRLPWEATIAGVFVALGFYSLLSLSERLQDLSVMLLGLGVGSVAFRWMNGAPVQRMAFLRRSLPAVIGAVLLTTVAIVGGAPLWESYQLRRLPAPPASAPNVLVIVLDTVRADRLGSYGYTKAATPFLDRIASQGARFENAIASSSWTLPSHATVFTGHFAHEHGAMLNNPLDERFPTLAETLAANGYATAGFAANNGVLTKAFGLARGFHHWEGISFNAFDAAKRTVLGRKLKHVLFRPRFFAYDRRLDRMQAPQVSDRFLGWLDGLGDRRFFAFLNFMEVHDPENTLAGDIPLFSLGRRRRPGDGLAHLNDAYDRSLTHLDSQIGKLFDELRNRKLDDNLLVVITSDHGESLGERGLFNHRTSLYSEQIRVPLLIRFPKKVAAGQVINRPVSLRDLSATILGDVIPGAVSPLPGHSLIGLLRDSQAQVSPAICEVEGTPYPGVPKEWPTAQGWVRSEVTPEWQYILQENGKDELYPAPRYSAEISADVARKPESQALIGEFRRRLLALPRAADVGR